MSPERNEVIRRISEVSLRSRRRILDMALAAGASSAHIGGALSFVEIASTLFSSVMRHKPDDPGWSDRDRFILSKGHGCLGYYAILAEMGYIPEEDLLTFEKSGSYLLGHPVINRAKGIEYSTGSLGMGLSLGLGVALAARKRHSPLKVYVLLGDGECNEGSVWEAALSAVQFKLDNVVAIVDRNAFQQTGSNLEIMSVGDLAKKWTAFGWNVAEVDGHDPGQLLDALSAPAAAGVPRALVAHTVKGKGVSFSENNNAWHHGVLTQALYDTAVAELGALQR